MPYQGQADDVESDIGQAAEDQKSVKSMSSSHGAPPPQQDKQEKDDMLDLKEIPHATTVWQAAIEDFSPVWYTISMSSGVLSIIMARFPYQFRGLPVLTDIMYLIDLTTFCLITSIMIARFVMFPRAVLRKMSKDYEEICLWTCAPLTLLTIAALTGSQVSNAYWGGHAFSLVAYVLWWIGMAWMVLTTVAIFIALFRLGLVYDRSLSTAIMLPAVGIATAGTAGGFIVNYAFDVSARLAVPTIIVGYFCTGYAIFLALILYTIFIHRLMANGWPPPAKIPAMCLLMGPFGQSSTSLQLLGTAASGKSTFANYASGTFLRGPAAASLSSASTLVALLLLGLEYFWLLIVLFSILEAALKRQLSYSPMWWSTIFPVGTMCTAWLVLSVELDSPAFRAITVGLYLILLVNYLINWVFTIRGVFWGTLFFKRSKEDLEGEKETMEKLD